VAKSAESRDRRATAAKLRAEQERKDRRRSRLLVLAGAVVVIGLIAVAGTVIAREAGRQAEVAEAAAAPIAGVQEKQDLSANHVTALPEPTPTAGTLLPPVGGDHDPVPQNCGIYTQPVATANAVHSMEHGAVWITYLPDISAAQLDALTGLATDEPYALLSPFPDQASPVVLSAWGVQLELDDADDPRAGVFLEKYRQGPQTPEPGAACSGGLGSPA
jgi:hypothetical protein